MSGNYDEADIKKEFDRLENKDYELVKNKSLTNNELRYLIISRFWRYSECLNLKCK